MTTVYPKCQYSHVTWIRKDSDAFLALSAGLKSQATAPAAVAKFLTNLVDAHKKFSDGLGPGADTRALLKAYQDATGILSTRDYTLPDIPDNSNDPGGNFIADVINGIAGALSTEVGIGISLYALAMDLVAMFDIKLHLQGVLFNTAASDLVNLDIRLGQNGLPNVMPLATTIPAAKPVMNPIDKKNYDCVGFVLFGGVGFEALQGFNIVVRAQRPKTDEQIGVYCQFYAAYKGIAPGYDERSHAPLRDFYQTREFTGVMVEKSGDPNGAVAIVCG